MVRCYFAYGSNMNTARVRERGLAFSQAERATLPGFRLEFNKQGRDHPGSGHANVVWDPASSVEGVLFWLATADEIALMDRFERAPVNYSRDIVDVLADRGPVASWIYFANPGVLRSGLYPTRSYLEHLLAGQPYLSRGYFERLRNWPCAAEPQ